MRLAYIIVRSLWHDIIVLNIHTPAENKIDYVKYNFWEELESVFPKFPTYHMKILFGDVSCKVGKEDILKTKI
jgi:hypothetical protein